MQLIYILKYKFYILKFYKRSDITRKITILLVYINIYILANFHESFIDIMCVIS